MSNNRSAQPIQSALFGASPSCPNIDNLPLIVEPQGSIEVLAPGSLYQPLLLSPHTPDVDAGPGKLDQYEEAFIRDLIRRLYPAGNHPKSDKTPLRWGDKEIWLKRNIEKRNDSFRLRVDESDWFYPDFIVWIVDHKTRTQTFGFVDPKGLVQGMGEGWENYKLISTLYMPHVVERQLAANGLKVEFEGEQWTFRLRGVLISNSPFANLSTQAKFNVMDEMGRFAPPTLDDFKRGRIVFQRADGTYIDDVLRLLIEDTTIDHLLALSAHLFESTPYFTPSGELECDLDLRKSEKEQTESEFVAALLRDYLKPDAIGMLGTWARKRRRQELMDYAAEGRWGFGGKKISDIRDHPAPCGELWKRKRK